MFYQKFAPSISLQSFIECYYIWEHHTWITNPLQVESPPSGFTAMVFIYGDRYNIINTQQQSELVPRCFLAGQLTSHYKLQLSGHIGMVGIVFKPAALSTLFRIPMIELTNQRIDLEAVFGQEAALLTERIAETKGHFQKISVLEEFLLHKISDSHFTLDTIDYAIDIILEKQGILSIKELVTELSMSRRQFERKFIYKVGLPPKYYSRVKRLGYICSLLITHKNPDWQEIIYEGGFYDQSHFIKDFVEFIQQNPSLYYKQHNELFNFLER